MLKKLLLTSFVLLAGWSVPSISVHAQEARRPNMLLFYGQGCPHCAGAREFLEKMKNQYPQFTAQEYEVYFDHDNAALFQRVADVYGVDVGGVPSMFLGNEVAIGFSEKMAEELEEKIVQCLQVNCSVLMLLK